MINERMSAFAPSPSTFPPSHTTGVATSARLLLGARVRNEAGEPLGYVDDLAIDAELGVVAYVLLAFDALDGVRKRFVIPWSALRQESGAAEFILDLDPQVLDRAPGIGGYQNDGAGAAAPTGRRPDAAPAAHPGDVGPNHRWRQSRAEWFGRS